MKSPSPEQRALAERLFAAARAEQPATALGRRLALIDSSESGTRLVLPARRAPVRTPGWGSAAALVLASAAGLWLLLRPQTAAVHISAERASRTSVTRASEPVAPPSLAARPETHAEPSVAAARAADVREAAPAPAVAARAVAPKRPAAPARAEQRARSEPAQPSLAAPAPERAELLPQPSAPSAAETAKAPSTLLWELDVLKRARAALRAGESQRAIELLDGHARQRSSSALEAESTLLRIEALAQLGRRREASDLAARFLRAYPNSALADRARSFISNTAASP